MWKALETWRIRGHPAASGGQDLGPSVRVSRCRSPCRTGFHAFCATIVLLGALPVGSGAAQPVLVRPYTMPTSGPPFERALVLDGVQYTIAEDDSELDVGSRPGEAFTVEAWVNQEGFGEAQIVSKPGAYALYLEPWAAYEGNARCCYFEIYGSFGDSDRSWMGYCISPGRGLSRPGWHHIAAVFEQVFDVVGVMSIYTDGWLDVQQVVGVGHTVNNSAEPLVVGEHFRGQIDEVRISATARYTDTFAVPDSPFACDGETMALWHFDESEAASTLHDACGATDNALYRLSSHVYLPLALGAAQAPWSPGES